MALLVIAFFVICLLFTRLTSLLWDFYFSPSVATQLRCAVGAIHSFCTHLGFSASYGYDGDRFSLALAGLLFCLSCQCLSVALCVDSLWCFVSMPGFPVRVYTVILV